MADTTTRRSSYRGPSGEYLKLHTEALIKDLGYARACSVSGKSKATLGRYASLADENADRYIPVNVLLDGGFDLTPYLASNSCLVVTNDTVGPLYLDKLRRCLGETTITVVSLPDGESHKTMDAVCRILDELVAYLESIQER